MPFPSSFPFLRAPSPRSGFTLREMAFFLGALALLAAVICGPVSQYLAQKRLANALQNARTLNLFLTQYATDNDNVYPVGTGTSAPGTSEGIARRLLDDKYAADPAIFSLASHPYIGTATDFSDFQPVNIDWDFTAGATPTTGLTGAAPGTLPTLYCTGETVVYPQTPGTGLDLTLSGHGPFGKQGIIVAYKNGDVLFVTTHFIPPTFPGQAKYTQIKP